jgi:Zn-dependent peptidase ImmA (M78 family)/transcriptional regulator with XRE-family HTH domain
MQQTVPVNPDILRWARIEAGYSLYDAVQCAGITPPRKKKNESDVTAEQRLTDWEEGRDAPSFAQLEGIANAYRRPLFTFFLPKPPEKTATIADYRTLGSRMFPTDTPELSALRRRLNGLHQELCALAKDAGGQKLPFIGSLPEDTPVSEFAESIRSVLRVDIEEQAGFRDEKALLGYLRTAAQNIGIYVIFDGNLGSYHSKISADEFRGIAIADEFAPMVVINTNDFDVAKVFTLVHELAHLWLGTKAISSFNALGENSDYISKERLCNRVAAEFLVPESDLREKWEAPQGDIERTVKDLAKHFNVSEAVIARRLLDLDFITSAGYGKLLAFYQARWKMAKDKQSEKGGSPGPVKMAKHRLGQNTIRTIITAVDNGRIGLQDAARLMNIPVSRFGTCQQF